MKTLYLSLSAMIFALTTTSPALAAPSEADAVLGESGVTTQVQKGLNVTDSEKRYLLPTGKIAGENSTLITAKAKVEKLNADERLITIRTEDGKVTTLKAGEEVRNFPQIKIGDEVQVDYYLSISFETREPTKTETQVSGDLIALAGRAEPGQKPAAGIATSQVKVMTIESIDQAKQLVVLRDLDGVLSTVKAKYPENLKHANTGDKIVVTMTEALAAKVTTIN